MIKQKGYATLEAAGFALIMLGLFVGGVAVSTFIQSSHDVTKILDREIYDAAVVPFSFNGSGQIVTNQAELQVFVDQVADNIELALQNLEDGSLPSTRYYIEAGYADVNIDPTTGNIDGVTPYNLFSAPTPFAYLVTRGTSALISEGSYSTTYFADEVQSIAQNQTYSVVTTHFSAGGNQYLPRRVIVGARVLFKSDTGFTGTFFQSLGGNSVIQDQKVVPVRGQVE
ncbi:MAG: hypothetical protein H6619_00405 [Deltaproteobacteria bacterium]|nr:hypothetical protein [Deltaproteobacteria bacterium]